MAHVSAAERRPQLIKAAIDLMTREGVAAGSTRAIAAELGVAQATVHYTFGTKEGLYLAVMEQLTDDLLTQVKKAAPENAGFEETLSTLAVALWRTVREQPSNHQLLTELSMFGLRVPALTDAAEIVTEAAARTSRPLAHPAEIIARFFLAGFDGLTTQRLSMPDEESERACLQALLSSTLALANGQLDLVTVDHGGEGTADSDA
jgi:AcrR family transcriptional regulator